jgi:hypothetical protein
LQLLFSCYVLYQTRGNQIQLYGYAAYGLIVIPYAVMSIINLAANVLVPHYPTLYMVRTSYMTEAELHGGVFEGFVADLANEQDTDEPPGKLSVLRWSVFCLILMVALCAPYVVIGALTGFEVRSSTTSQRGWTMAWLVGGQFYGSLEGAYQWDSDANEHWIERVLPILILSVPAIGGMVTVGQMLRAHGEFSSTVGVS